ncbi:MAG: transaldolase family protein [bacterium]|nr:transaldolase family protein [bacterium]
MKTKIFLDSGDPSETREAIKLLGFLDGQTTNPTLIAKNPDAASRLAKGEKFTEAEILDFYKKTVQEISGLIPKGSVSIEVYADNSTTADQMLKQGREFFAWIPNAHIKYPTSVEGLKAAEISVKEGIRVNMTLCFSQEQAAAVHAATKGASMGQVFVSPFIGRLDDLGENGMDLIKNIIKMYGEASSHVEVLTASVRSEEHVALALALGSDIITMPLKVLENSKSQITNPKQIPISKFELLNLKPIPYQELDLSKPWQELYQEHELTVKGMQKFSEDWNKLYDE